MLSYTHKVFFIGQVIMSNVEILERKIGVVIRILEHHQTLKFMSSKAISKKGVSLILYNRHAKEVSEQMENCAVLVDILALLKLRKSSLLGEA